jgi:hypothetical protein
MPSFPVFFGPFSFAGVLGLGGLVFGLAWTLGRLLGWRAWWTRPILLAVSWAGLSFGFFVLLWLSGADVFLFAYILARMALPGALMALPLWWLGDWLVKKID